MNNPTPNRPLWEVMRDALSAIPKDTSFKGGDGFVCVCVAAQLRALAEELAKKQSEWRANCTDMSAVMWLMEEADRADAGNG
jgi:hypothetical protein